LYAPEHKSLVSQDTRDATHKLLAEIRGAETARELLIYARNLHIDANEFRNLLNVLESELIGKIEQFARESETVAERPRIVPEPEERGRRG
jgi:hypothetical protein